MLRRAAADFHPPRELMKSAKEEMSSVPNERLFNSSQHEKSREKWCAAMLGLGYEKCAAPCRVAVNDSEERKTSTYF